MMTSWRDKKGFSLVETLVVVVVLGVITTALYSLYLTHMRNAYAQDEVVEVQQNLRIALDSITKDLKMAGILVPIGTNPISGGTGTTLQITTASPYSHFARVTQGPYLTSAGMTSLAMNVDGADGFSASDTLRVIKSFDNSQPLAPGTAGVTLVAAALNSATPSITLGQSPGSPQFAAGIQINAGDIIAKAAGNGTAANLACDVISYSLVTNATLAACPAGQSCLARAINGKSADGASSADLVASNLTGLAFSFNYDNASEDSTPGAAGAANALNQIKSVRVIVTGATAKSTGAGWAPKTRRLTSVIKLRNRRSS
jgi:prepilin-type N-terminal cleavage/methylation domain-containing protein